MYSIETKIASKRGWHTPSEAKAYYGRYSRTGVTVHWWNSPSKVKDSDHDNIVRYILGKASNGTGSVNYVLSNNKITLMVHPDNVAWASQAGNPTTVSVEFSPHLNGEGYKKAGWLIWQLEKRYNRKLALYKHSDWFSTACPGTLDLKRMRAEANKWANGGYNPKPAPVKTAQLSWKRLSAPKKFVTNKQPTNLWNFNTTSWNMTSVKKFDKNVPVTIFGTVTNESLGATYLLTEYSYTNKITNGFNQADLDEHVVAKPKPMPEPPKETPKPTNPTPTVPSRDSEFDERLTALEKTVQLIAEQMRALMDALSSWLAKFKN